MIRIGIIGKVNTGKTTFFNASTLLQTEVSTYPFTTKRPNRGIAYVRTICVCRELGVQDRPRNSKCIDGWRFIPVELVDLPGLIKGSWRGKGLGTQFLSVASQADALLHVVDASASVDADGKLTRPGLGNPVSDVYDIEEELARWFTRMVDKSLSKASRQADEKTVGRAVFKALAGLKVRLDQIQRSLREAELADVELKRWKSDDIERFAVKIREISKPTMIIANKMDLAYAEENYRRLSREFGKALVIPCSADAELALCRAEEKGYIRYVPGEETFQVLAPTKLTPEQSKALAYVQQRVFTRWIRTGVQFALNSCVFKLLNMNCVYPVEDEVKFSDKKGNVLPDVILVPYNATLSDVAGHVHSELAQTIVCGIDARTGVRLPADYIVRDRDVIKIVAAAEPRSRRTTKQRRPSKDRLS
jgi:ribosome-binding ATPase YchF (GTP1/OBG family)